MMNLGIEDGAVRRRALALLCARLLASAGTTMIVPYLVLLLTREMGLSALSAAMFGSLVFVGGRLVARPMGILADRLPRMQLMPACLGCGGGAVLVFSLDPSSMSFAAAAMACVGLSLSSTAFMILLRAHFARSFPRACLTQLCSVSSSVFNIGIFAGAAIGGYCLDSLGAGSMATMSALLQWTAAAAVYIATRHDEASETGRNGRAPAGSAALADLQGRTIAPFVMASVVLGYLTTTVSVNLALYAAVVFGNGALASLFFSTQSLALMVLLPWMGVVAARAGRDGLYRMYFAGLVVLALGYCVFAAVPVSWPASSIGALAFFFCLSQCLAIPSTDPLLTQLFGNASSGRLFGTTTSAAAGGGMLACALNGLGMDRMAAASLYWLWLAPGLIGICILLGAAAWGVRMLRGKQGLTAFEAECAVPVRPVA